ncbi:MAG: hypothetical protein HQL76_13845 [Magnetococcales bacterium]|nr:hypothetical protein [Magnetococcales bacterium]
MSSSITTISNTPGMDVLGWTYNIYGKYASALATVQCVVQDLVDFNDGTLSSDSQTKQKVGNNTYAYPRICTFQDVAEASSFSVYGSNYQSFESNLSLQVGASVKYGAFAASVSSEYSETTRATSSNQFYRLVDNYSSQIARLENPSTLTFTSAFYSALNDTTNSSSQIKTLFRTYGSHLVTGVVLGGECRMNCYSSTTTYSSQTTFTNEAKAKYNNAVGQARFSTTVSSSDTSWEENIQEDSSLEIVGGSVTAQNALINNQDWDTWAKSVMNAPAIVDFMAGGLTPIWNLCTDQTTRAKNLESAFESLYTPRHTTPVWTKSPNSDGNNSSALSWNIDVDLVGTSLASRIPYLVMTGFGARIDKDTHVTRIGVQVTDLGTGQVYYFVKGDQSNFQKDQFEQFGTVPSGCVLTGIGFRESNNNLSDLTLYYQVLDMAGVERVSTTDGGGTTTTVDGGLLGGTVFSKVIGGSSQEQSYVPLAGNTSVMTGIQVASSHGKGGFCTLNVYLATLYREVDN